MHRTTKQFRKYFEKLPEPIRVVSKKNFKLLKDNPSHPSLHFKKIGKLWSVRAGDNYRALAVKNDKDFIWVWIGTHDEYIRMIKNGLTIQFSSAQ
jgi:mRNA-degrading endonuclease RelE of RelBE toxin-antitoxin system